MFAYLCEHMLKALRAKQFCRIMRPLARRNRIQVFVARRLDNVGKLFGAVEIIKKPDFLGYVEKMMNL